MTINVVGDTEQQTVTVSKPEDDTGQISSRISRMLKLQMHDRVLHIPIPNGGRPNTDLWPDVSEYSPSELFPAPDLKNVDGEPIFLFSSRHPKTVRHHFHRMAKFAFNWTQKIQDVLKRGNPDGV
ncbi:hypothetical protein EDB19DRAFT_2024687 [Suillus lakei]|nr:hypothetical protein EDB19DRAFT_2024687 [Suillus lakei]